MDQEGAITLPARKLVEIVRELPSAADPDHRLRRAAGDDRVRPLQVPAARPAAGGVPRLSRRSSSTAGGARSAKDLQKLIAHVAFAASTEESRPILNGVLWELRPERMRMVATNGHRLARMDVPTAAGGQLGQADLIVPPKALEQIRRLFGDEERSRSPGARTTSASAPPPPRSSPG